MPVTFLRTVTARDPREELALASQLEECIASRNPCLDFRVVFMVHDQGLRAPSVELAPLSQRMSLWALSYDLTAGDSLFDKCSKAYTSVLMHTVDDANWPLSPVNVARDPLHLSYLYANAEKRVLYADDTVRYGDVSFDDLTAAQFPWRQHDNLALIDGVASVGGTCTGVGSTWMKGAPPSEVEGDAGPSCYYCGNCSFHLAGKPVATNRPFTDEEDETIIVHLYKILTGGDKVEEVEKLAHQMNRGAFEIICRIQYLTAASTKITDDMNPLHPSSL
ncbi:hypothetical protein AGDE_08374 [Angomonas deanei]|nr:hypothetical protein AGDE_11343 [Angomonas deanei]EPY33056.1 hypothetical protein AGDE_08374 [Angomonas deanei]|eukprot:EPY26419.1 hypothetical protein AGDE_11343 [Angomonas deanei]